MAFYALRVEEGALPFLNGVQALDSREDRMRPGGDVVRAAGHHHLGVATRDSLLVEVEDLCPGLNGEPEAEVAFHEGGVGG